MDLQDIVVNNRVRIKIRNNGGCFDSNSFHATLPVLINRTRVVNIRMPRKNISRQHEGGLDGDGIQGHRFNRCRKIGSRKISKTIQEMVSLVMGR